MDPNWPGFDGIDQSSGIAAVLEIAFPGSRCSVRYIPGIASRGEIQCAVRRNVVHGLSSGAVLENGLVGIENIVDDNVASIGETKSANVVREAGLTVIGGCEEDIGPRRQIVNDFHHAGAFVRSIRRTFLPFEDRGIKGKIATCN